MHEHITSVARRLIRAARCRTIGQQIAAGEPLVDPVRLADAIIQQARSHAPASRD